MSPAGPDTDAVRAQDVNEIRGIVHMILPEGHQADWMIERLTAALHNAQDREIDQFKDHALQLIAESAEERDAATAARDALAGEVKELREENGEIAADQQLLWRENQKLRALLTNLVDPEDCQFDHHGGCQEHGFLYLEPGEICPNQAARDILATPAAENGANQ